MCVLILGYGILAFINSGKWGSSTGQNYLKIRDIR